MLNKPIRFWIVLGLSMVLFVSWCLWHYTKDLNAQAFGLNLFTEILGVGISVVLIDQLLRRLEAEKRIPQRRAQYDDFVLFHNRLVTFWTKVYTDAVPKENPTSIGSLFTPTAFDDMVRHLDFDAPAWNQGHPTTWWTYFIDNLSEWRQTGDKILDRHAGHVDPVAFSALHAIVESPYHALLRTMCDLHAVATFAHVSTNVSGHAIFPDYFKAVNALHKWCTAEYAFLRSHYSDHELRGVTVMYPTAKRLPPRCALDLRPSA